MAEPSPTQSSRTGVLYALGAYGLWGFFPLYWALLKQSAATEVLGHRISGTFLLLLAGMTFTGQIAIIRGLDRRRLLLLGGASALITINWLTYIWGVQNEHVVETSLGYFINPLVNVALGVTILGERMRRSQVVAIALACIAVGILTFDYGRVPWIALVLAFSFAFYGLLKKQAGVASLPALTVETAFVAPAAMGYLLWLRTQGADTLFRIDWQYDALLLGAGLATAVPLLLFGGAANRIPLSTLGVLQYVGPTIQFVCGITLLGESMSRTRWLGFSFVWAALVIFAWDGLRQSRRPPPRNGVQAALLGLAFCGICVSGCQREGDGPWHGKRSLLVLPLQWEDTTPQLTRDELEELLFAGDHSLSAWFAENSDGRFRLQGEVLDWKHAGEPFAPKRDRCGPDKIAERALRAHGETDLSTFDSDDDGLVDDLLVVHTGRGNIDRLSHRCVFGKKGPANRFAALQQQGLGSKGDSLPIGLYAHEGAHSFYRLRDHYGDETQGDYGIGVWGVMGYGQWGPDNRIPLANLWARPTTMAAFNKEQLGWIRLREVRKSTSNLALRPVETSGRGMVAMVKGHRYILEMRGGTGSSAQLPGRGLLVWRKPPGGSSRLVQADGRNDLGAGTPFVGRPLPPNELNWGDSGDPFPGSGGVAEWVDPTTGFEMRNIALGDDRVTFDLVLPRAP